MEIEPRVGVGPLKLLMTRGDVSAILGAPHSLYDPSDDEILDDDDLPFYRDQIVEVRKGGPAAHILDLTFESDRLVCINLRGRAPGLSIRGMAIATDRMGLLAHVAAIDPEIYVRRENYAFMSTGLCVSRAKNGKSIDYVRLYDLGFKARRLEFELYQKHIGPIVP